MTYRNETRRWVWGDDDIVITWNDADVLVPYTYTRLAIEGVGWKYVFRGHVFPEELFSEVIEFAVKLDAELLNDINENKAQLKTLAKLIREADNERRDLAKALGEYKEYSWEMER